MAELREVCVLEGAGTPPAATWAYTFPLDAFHAPDEGPAPKPHYSPRFAVGEISWRFMAVIVGGDVGVYIECDGVDGEENWCVHTSFRMETIAHPPLGEADDGVPEPSPEAPSLSQGASPQCGGGGGGALPQNVEHSTRHYFVPAAKVLGFPNQVPLRAIVEAWRQYAAAAEAAAFPSFLVPGRGAPAERAAAFPHGEYVEVRVTIKQHTPRPGSPHRGIMNQGATCYLNSLLQTLHHLPMFRELTFRLSELIVANSDAADLAASMPFCLGKLFFDLQGDGADGADPAPVSTAVLTKSFGWGRLEAVEQHDVQELARILIDTLEQKMKSTETASPRCAAGSFADGVPLVAQFQALFRGTIRSFIKCLSVDYQSSRTEHFYDIQLCVRNCPTLRAAFQQELAQETLEGDNAYHVVDEATGLDSMQQARKGMEWLAFPPVLFLHLRRFEYDYTRDCYTKISDRCEFHEELDLEDYYRTEHDPPAGEAGGSPAWSDAGSAPAPSGDEAHQPVSPGLRLPTRPPPPLQDTSLLSSSTQCSSLSPLISPQHAPLAAPVADSRLNRSMHLRAPGGGEEHKYRLHAVLVHSGTVAGGHYYSYVKLDGEWFRFDDAAVSPASATEAVEDNFGGYEGSARFWLADTSAYMLVYTKASCAAEFAQRPVYFPSPRLQEAFSKHAPAPCDEAGLPFTFHLTTEADLHHHEHVGLRPAGWRCARPLRVPRRATYAELLKEMEEHLKHLRPDPATREKAPPRLWLWVERVNGTIRAAGPLRTLALAEGRGGEVAKKNALVEEMFVPLPPGGREPAVELHVDWGRALKKHEVHLFIKEYTPEGGLRYVASHTCPQAMKVQALAAHISKAQGFSKRVSLRLWEERRPSLVLPLPPTATLSASGLRTGDVVIFEVDPQDAPGVRGLRDFLKFVLSKTTVTFCDARQRVKPFQDDLRLSDAHDTVVQAVARGADVPPERVRLHGAAGAALAADATAGVTLAEMLTFNKTVTYAVLPYAVADAVGGLEVRVKHYSCSKATVLLDLPVLLPRAAAAADALAAVADALAAEAKLADAERRAAGALRLLRAAGGRVTAVLEAKAALLPHAQEGGEFISTVAPPRAEGAGRHVEVAVCHFEKVFGKAHILNLHSLPFIAPVPPGAAARDVLRQLAQRLGVVKQERVDGWRLALVKTVPSPGGDREVCVGALDGPLWPAAAALLGGGAAEADAVAALDVALQREKVVWMLGIERRDESRRTCDRGGISIKE
eukprot:TRINITY_DN6170_c0_g1_i1.p1 TRINITY_DN6170_c0_g1~~TRINITY_DN6170_c0_g1_i1.p1  ORF type:complete len:1247 (+),score=437.40 TRINITY_DN6170_c0_g1_i1:97-3837(+)